MIAHGNWPVANFDMAAALAFRGYDYRFEFGPGAHDLKHGAAVFPATLRVGLAVTQPEPRPSGALRPSQPSKEC